MKFPAFEGDDLRDFIARRASGYGISVDNSVARSSAIHSVTSGYPLFVDDLIRYSALVGIDTAVSDWTHRQGDAAREYALTRQLQHLEGVSGDVLLAVAVSNRPLTMMEVGQLAGITDEDAELGIGDLLKWQLLHKSVRKEDSIPVFNMNANTKRLTLNTFKASPKLSSMKTAFAVLTGERMPEAKIRAIATAIAEARRVLQAAGIDAAAESLKSSMTGELREAPDLYGNLGWIYARSNEYAAAARESFETAHRLGTKKVDPYFHWVEMEKTIAERAVGNVEERELLRLWRQAIKVVEIGLERCGEVDSLCNAAGYLRAREAKTHEHLNEFAYAQGAYKASVDWLQRALTAPGQASGRVSRYHVYRGLTISYVALNDVEGVVRSINRWRTLARDDVIFFDEVRRITRTIPEVERRLPWIQSSG